MCFFFKDENKVDDGEDKDESEGIALTVVESFIKEIVKNINMNKYHLDVITGAEGTTGLGVNKLLSWGGTKNYVIKATNYAVDADTDTYVFWNQEQKVDEGLNRVPVARFPISRTIIIKIETPTPDEKIH